MSAPYFAALYLSIVNSYQLLLDFVNPSTLRGDLSLRWPQSGLVWHSDCTCFRCPLQIGKLGNQNTDRDPKSRSVCKVTRIDNFTAVVTGSEAGFPNSSEQNLPYLAIIDLHHKSWRNNGVVAPVVQMHRPGDHVHKANIQEHEGFIVKLPLVSVSKIGAMKAIKEKF